MYTDDITPNIERNPNDSSEIVSDAHIRENVLRVRRGRLRDIFGALRGCTAKRNATACADAAAAGVYNK